MSESPIHPAVATAVGAVLAGVVGGMASMVAGTSYGIAVGIAIALPVFYQFGYGVGSFARGRYHDERDRRGLAIDAVATALGGIVVGAVGAAAADALSFAEWPAVVIATAAAFLGGAAVFVWRTAEYQGAD